MGFEEGRYQHQGEFKRTTTEEVEYRTKGTTRKTAGLLALVVVLVGAIAVGVISGPASVIGAVAGLATMADGNSTPTDEPMPTPATVSDSPTPSVEPIDPTPSASPALSTPSASLGEPIQSPQPTMTSIESLFALEFITDFLMAARSEDLVVGDLRRWFTEPATWYANEDADHRDIYRDIHPEPGSAPPSQMEYSEPELLHFEDGDGVDVLIVRVEFESPATSGHTDVRYVIVPSSGVGPQYRIQSVKEAVTLASQ